MSQRCSIVLSVNLTVEIILWRINCSSGFPSLVMKHTPAEFVPKTDQILSPINSFKFVDINTVRKLDGVIPTAIKDPVIAPADAPASSLTPFNTPVSATAV